MAETIQQQQQQEVLTPEQIVAKQQQLIKYFMHKKGLSHLQDKVVDNLAKLELAMENEGVSFEDIQAGRATENIFNLLENLNKSKVVVEGVLAHQFKKSHEAGEFEQIAKESENYIINEEKKQVEDKEVREAFENFQNNPTSANQFEYFKKARGNLTHEERFAKEEAQRKERHNRALDEVKQGVIENNARAEAIKEINRQRLISGEDQKHAEREEALGDKRIKKVIPHPTHALDVEIEARKQEIIKDEYSS